jgi:hypothetical protein
MLPDLPGPSGSAKDETSGDSKLRNCSFASDRESLSQREVLLEEK